MQPLRIRIGITAMSASGSPTILGLPSSLAASLLIILTRARCMVPWLASSTRQSQACDVATAWLRQRGVARRGRGVARRGGARRGRDTHAAGWPAGLLRGRRGVRRAREARPASPLAGPGLGFAEARRLPLPGAWGGAESRLRTSGPPGVGLLAPQGIRSDRAKPDAGTQEWLPCRLAARWGTRTG